ncbi:MAG: hypothetical protein WKF93_05995 [Acidimicrobiales bacterium]
MTLVRLPGPFDDPARSAAPATPTCCSCCCCCCLVTTATSATLNAVYVNHLAAAGNRGGREWVTVGVALALPFALFAMNRALTVLERSGGERTFVLGLVLAVVLYAATMAGLFVAAGRRPGSAVASSLAVTAAVSAALFIEFITFGFLIWGQLLAIPVPIVAGKMFARSLRNHR